MAVRFTLTMNTSITDGATMRSECTQIAEMLERVAQKIQSTHLVSGTMNDRNGLGTVTSTYTAMSSANAKLPPPEVARAAGQVQAWLDQQNAKPAPPEVVAKMTPAQRLDYARLFDQSRMPAWRDPRRR